MKIVSTPFFSVHKPILCLHVWFVWRTQVTERQRRGCVNTVKGNTLWSRGSDVWGWNRALLASHVCTSSLACIRVHAYAYRPTHTPSHRRPLLRMCTRWRQTEDMETKNMREWAKKTRFKKGKDFFHILRNLCRFMKTRIVKFAQMICTELISASAASAAAGVQGGKGNARCTVVSLSISLSFRMGEGLLSRLWGYVDNRWERREWNKNRKSRDILCKHAQQRLRLHGFWRQHLTLWNWR